LGEAPTSRELDLVAAALEDEHDAFWLAANDRAAFAELTQVALGVAQFRWAAPLVAVV
jgi:hypothetical protein